MTICDSRLATTAPTFRAGRTERGDAREALLREPDFRRAFEEERALDRQLASAARGSTRRSRAPVRPRVRSRSERMPRPLCRRCRGGASPPPVLVAGMLGGALDLVLPRPRYEPSIVAIARSALRRSTARKPMSAAAVLPETPLAGGRARRLAGAEWLSDRHARRPIRLQPHRGGFSGERFTRFELRRFDDRLPKQAVDRSPRR